MERLDIWRGNRKKEKRRKVVVGRISPGKKAVNFQLQIKKLQSKITKFWKNICLEIPTSMSCIKKKMKRTIKKLKKFCQKE